MFRPREPGRPSSSRLRDARRGDSLSRGRLRTRSRREPSERLSPSASAASSCRDGYPLYPDEVQPFGLLSLHLETKLNGLANPLHQLIQRTRLRVAATQRRDGRDVVALGVSLNHDIELSMHSSDGISAVLRTSVEDVRVAGGQRATRSKWLERWGAGAGAVPG